MRKKETVLRIFQKCYKSSRDYFLVYWQWIGGHELNEIKNTYRFLRLNSKELMIITSQTIDVSESPGIRDIARDERYPMHSVMMESYLQRKEGNVKEDQLHYVVTKRTHIIQTRKLSQSQYRIGCYTICGLTFLRRVTAKASESLGNLEEMCY